MAVDQEAKMESKTRAGHSLQSLVSQVCQHLLKTLRPSDKRYKLETKHSDMGPWGCFRFKNNTHEPTSAFPSSVSCYQEAVPCVAH